VRKRPDSPKPKRRYVRPSTGSGQASRDGTPRPKRRYVRFTRWRRRRFFALLEESGNVRVACELAGVGLGCIYTLRRREPGFIALMEAAVAKADRRLAEQKDENAPPPPFGRSPSPGKPGEELADEDLVIRRGIGGRLRAMAPSRRWWTARHDPIFFGHLRATGNVAWSARATGFTPKTAYNRRDRLPGFARTWEAMLDEAEPRLDARLTAEALKGSWAFDREVAEPGEPETFDVDFALRLLTWREKRRLRRMRAEKE
jgi:hypothetical protein